jgi:YidC/Oxa1 family membrane protein insertase
MFTTLIVQPIFNLLALIYALLPGHNFGLSLIIFTIIIRLLLWPLIKKQLHQAKAMRKLQPEIKKIKLATKGNRQKESMMLMELYKERGINPFATFPTLIVQLIILIGLYSGLRKVIDDPQQMINFAYPFIQHLPWMEQLSHNIHQFDNTLFGFVDLSRAALKNGGGIYLPAMIIVIGSAVAQYFQSKQLMPQDKEKRSLRTILKDAGAGKQADQSEVNAAVGRSTLYLLPFMIFIFTVNLASALSLYWLVGGIVAFIQQSIVLNRDETEMEAIADKPSKNVAAIPEAEVVKTPKPAKKPAGKSKKQAKKRRKK